MLVGKLELIALNLSSESGSLISENYIKLFFFLALS